MVAKVVAKAFFFCRVKEKRYPDVPVSTREDTGLGGSLSGWLGAALAYYNFSIAPSLFPFAVVAAVAAVAAAAAAAAAAAVGLVSAKFKECREMFSQRRRLGDLDRPLDRQTDRDQIERQ